MKTEIPIRSKQGLTPLSPVQQRLWFLNQLEREVSTLSETTAFRLDGVLDLDSLRGALTAIVARHEVLRTTYTVSDSGQPVQEITAVAAIDLPVIDLGEVTQELQESEVQGIATELRRQPFDLVHDLPLRLVLIRLGSLSHILIAVTHCIASDEWSGKLFLNEFVALYQRVNQGETTSLPEPTLQYADYALWQREQLKQQNFSEHIAYWKGQFQNISTVELPTDHPRSGSKRNRLGRKLVTILDTLTDRLKILSDHQGATLFMTLLASFQVLLYRYTGQADIMVGSPIAGRPRPEMQGLLGNFGQVLAVRNDLSGNPSFRELLVKVKESASKAYEYADFPIETLLDEINPKYHIDHSRISQILFAFENCEGLALEIPGLAATPIEIDPITAPFDLFTTFIQQHRHLILRLDYNADLFNPDTIDRITVHFHNLLESIVTNPELAINDLTLLTEVERQQQLVQWNDTQVSVLHGKSCVEIFEEQVELTPDEVAVVFESTHLTYDELNQRANQLAHYLVKHGVRVATPVAVFLERSVDLIVGLIAVLKAGGIYVPLDANYPRERLTLMLKEIEAPLVLSVKSLETHLPVHSAQTILIDSAQREIDREHCSNPQLAFPVDSPAYVLFTSGSTGKPKGVVMGHGALANLISWQVKNFCKPVAARTLQFAPLGFDVSIQEILATVGSGGSLILVQDQLRRDAIGLLHYMQEHLIERVFLPFVALQQLADAATFCNFTPQSLREIITAGEQLHLTASLRLFLGRLGNCSLRNQYGPTESHVVTEFTLEPPFERWPDHPPIGQPIANTQVFILDPAMNPVPIGVTGEIFIGGAGLARGYVNQPELTAEKFIANPLSADANSRLYKTGDLGRYLPDGNIEFLGRIDHQVKIRGYRIELGEIETVLAQHSEVQAAVVVAREDSPGDKRLAGYVVLNHRQSVTAKELRSYLKEKLPEYMVPSAYVFLETFPLTPSGKVDRRALPIPDQDQSVSQSSYLAPRTATEETLASIWAEVLNVARIGIRDNFFDLGGHSLSAVRLTTRVQKQFNMPIRVADVYQAPTIEQFALFLQVAPQPTFSSLVSLNSEGSKCPFFWIHGEASDAYLPRHLGPDQPVYGLRHQSDDGQPAHYKSVEAIASHYLHEIRSVRAQGPYLLGGYCFGSLVALEMAQQLQTQGQKVDLLVFINPAYRQTTNGNESAPTPSLQDQVRRQLRNLSSLQLAEKWRYVLERTNAKFSEMVLSKFTPVKKAAQEMTWETCIRLGLSLPFSLRSPYILAIYQRAIQSYVPRPYLGRLVIFCDDDYPEPLRRAWSDSNPEQTTIYNVPGSHTSVLEEPNVGYWANKLKSCLDTLEHRPLTLKQGKLYKTRPSLQIITLIGELATSLGEIMQVFPVSQTLC